MEIIAIGIGTKDKQGRWLEFFFAEPYLNPPERLLDSFVKLTPDFSEPLDLIASGKLSDLQAALDLEDARQKKWHQFLQPVAKENALAAGRQLVAVLLTEDRPVDDVATAYLKLHLLSYRFFKPNDLNLSGIFTVLPNLAWSNLGPFRPEDIPEAAWRARITGQPFFIRVVDKIPPLTDYFVPPNVRIADSARVRLGAYIGAGTTIMHEGFVNFNAGTEGPNMVEGRISAGVWIKKNSDLGGGASTMGTLSGGGQVLISVGENCLIGANAGLGIPLGNNCTIEAGLYLTASTKVHLIAKDGQELKEIIKARELSNHDDLLFRRNSLTGKVECLTNINRATLNDMLHAHN